VPSYEFTDEEAEWLAVSVAGSIDSLMRDDAHDDMDDPDHIIMHREILVLKGIQAKLPEQPTYRLKGNDDT
jgi:hypothetical protein